MTLMKNIFFLSAISCLVLLLTAFPAQGQKNKKPAISLATISATVVDDERKPISNASIFVKEGASLIKTDAEGNFTAKATMDDQILIEAPGFQSILLPISEASKSTEIELTRLPFFMRESDGIHVPFGEFKKYRIPVAVTALNSEELMEFDTRQNVYDVLNGRVPGLFGSLNIRGGGDALVVVDGIPRPANTLNLMEVDQITVLRDLTSQMLYGAKAGQGVVLVTTKRGRSYKRTMNITAETGFQSAISYPEFLSSANYMELYNEARINDGEAPVYSQAQIANTRASTNPVLYPDQQYYTSDFLADNPRFQSVLVEGAGGNNVAQYYVNIGWNRVNGFLKYRDNEAQHSDRLNLRGNVDYQLNNWINLSLDGIAQLSFDKGPRYSGSDFWNLAATRLPNLSPLLIPINLLKDPGLINNATSVNGDFVLGGSTEFPNNPYGELQLNGFSNAIQRVAQINSGLSMDLKKITSGLTAKAGISFDLTNLYSTVQPDQYAVYQPVLVPGATGLDSLMFTKVGADLNRNDQDITSVDFSRRIGLFATLDYNRNFADRHDVSATLLGYRYQLSLNNVLQPQKDLHFGFRTNYMLDQKYIVELTTVLAGSPAFSKENRFALSPAIGLAWVLSREDFLVNNQTINFFKLRANFGVSKTDLNVPVSYLFQDLYNESGSYVYNNGTANNAIQLFAPGNPNLDWIKNREISIGFESMLFSNKIWLEAQYFNNKQSDLIVRRSNFYPDYYGGLIPYENYEAYGRNGIDLGLSLGDKSGGFEYQLGVNIAYSEPKALKVNEPTYADAYRQREGQPTDARFGWVAEGLFKDQADIEGHATQTFGAIQPGDIKYKDLNNDGIVDENDQQVIGNSGDRVNLGIHLNLKIKNLELFVLGTGQMGAERLLNSSYFWVFGDRKYSQRVLDRWTPSNVNGASYPRLSATENANNFRTSTFWQIKDDWFKIANMQLTFSPNVKSQTFKDLRVYLRGSNLFFFSKQKEVQQLNVTSSPQAKSIALGVNASF